MSREVRAFWEWSWTLAHCVPQAYYYYKKEQLSKTISNIGTKPIFFFNDEHVEDENAHWHNGSNNLYEHKFPYGKEWLAPPFKEHYTENNILKYDTPTIVINNKWNKEWGNKPFNVFDIDSVKKIVETFNEKYLILYIRAFGDEKGYGDSVSAEEFNDYEVLSEYNNVITIQDIMKEYPDYSYNEIQLMMEATSDKHLTVAGANAIISSYFCGDVLIYRNPNCNAGSRGIWMTDSWLSKLSGANIIGRDNRNELIKKAKRLWL